MVIKYLLYYLKYGYKSCILAGIAKRTKNGFVYLFK